MAKNTTFLLCLKINWTKLNGKIFVSKFEYIIFWNIHSDLFKVKVIKEYSY